jgi:hypothetical protein
MGHDHKPILLLRFQKGTIGPNPVIQDYSLHLGRKHIGPPDKNQ